MHRYFNIIFIILLIIGFVRNETEGQSCPLVQVEVTHDGCCSFPCQNQGVCVSENDGRFWCDCAGTRYGGVHCQVPTFRQQLRNTFSLSFSLTERIRSGFPLIWGIINLFPFIRRSFLRSLYISRLEMVPIVPRYTAIHHYPTMDVYYNRSLYTLILPPVPMNCPTESGVAGMKTLPPVDCVYARILQRTEFKPCPHKTNLLFAMYAQHFVYQFLKKDTGQESFFTFGKEGVDGSNIYGKDELTRSALRSFRDGKLKVRDIDGEAFPPHLDEAPGVDMLYPKGKDLDEMLSPSAKQNSSTKPKWALGHKMFSETPLIFCVATIWIREHNRVCDILRAEHNHWNDDRIFHTARNIVIGEMLQVTLSHLVSHLTQYKVRPNQISPIFYSKLLEEEASHIITNVRQIRLKYDPELLRNSEFQFSNRIHQELLLFYQWFLMLPDSFSISDQRYKFEDILFSNNQIVFKHGFNKVIEMMTKTSAGMLTWKNHGKLFESVTKRALKMSRRTRMQPFNNYRRFYGLNPYKTFYDLTGNQKIADELNDLYDHVDAVDFYVGMIVEKKRASLSGPSMITMCGAWTINLILANPLGSVDWWKPSTFGGKTGLDIVRKATLKKLFCNNMKGGCQGVTISFKVAKSVVEQTSVEDELPKSPKSSSITVPREREVSKC